MSKLLIIGASILQLPAIQKAKELGHTVAVADYNPNAVGISCADKYYNASTIDVAAICEVACDFQPDGIMTLATDMPMRSIAAATTLLGLPGISVDTAIKTTDKWEMIKAFKEYGVESPWYYVVEKDDDWYAVKRQISIPCIMKPTDNAGSRGVILVENYQKLDEAYQYSKVCSRAGSVIVEEYLKGNEVSVEIIVYKGDVHILAVTDKLTTGSPYFVEIGHSQPSCLSENDLGKIRDLAIRAIKAVNIENGPAHVEIMLTDKGPKMIELGARMGGDCIATHLVPLSTGVDMVKATIDIALGNKPDFTRRFFKGSAIHFFDVPRGVIKSIEGEEEIRKYDGIKEVVFTKKVGDMVTEIKSSIDRVGFVVAQGGDAREAIDKCMSVIKTLKFSVHER